ncbi:MAG: hypothetical protein ASUL_08319 [Candidatus Aramenus sulfurataquae]|jgi:hypothetical protein|uniref:Zinc ribbon domain-containing protein n=2 Tax=Candidatus Aramenus sulfurataquae TaxID=1326980 RepID=W7KTW5_9CREN|nr:MAG: hypothetical protein ASUL_08319 [Candidatus Aramenus sulfurataquae]MCL7344796.1 zinc ribbon domain-containing protein [Candidatus Aramenus sulfurataquae]
MQKRFENVNVNLQALAQYLNEWFISKGYQSQYFGYGNYYVIQAKKTGLLRHIFAADRAFTVKLMGAPGILDVNIGIADWVKAEDGIDAVAGDLILGPIGLLAEAGEGLWNLEIEKEVMGVIENYVRMNSYQAPQFPQTYYPQPYPQPPAYPQMRVCPSCGTQNPPNAKFCINCGTRLF